MNNEPRSQMDLYSFNDMAQSKAPDLAPKNDVYQSPMQPPQKAQANSMSFVEPSSDDPFTMMDQL